MFWGESSNSTYWSTDRRKIPDLIDYRITKNIRRETIAAAPCYRLFDYSPVTIQRTNIPTKRTPLKTKRGINLAIESFNNTCTWLHHDPRSETTG